jgi:hypothetical protein
MSRKNIELLFFSKLPIVQLNLCTKGKLEGYQKLDYIKHYKKLRLHIISSSNSQRA